MQMQVLLYTALLSLKLMQITRIYMPRSKLSNFVFFWEGRKAAPKFQNVFGDGLIKVTHCHTKQNCFEMYHTINYTNYYESL
jgi:hypothetical protein